MRVGSKLARDNLRSERARALPQLGIIPESAKARDRFIDITGTKNAPANPLGKFG